MTQYSAPTGPRTDGRHVDRGRPQLVGQFLVIAAAMTVTGDCASFFIVSCGYLVGRLVASKGPLSAPRRPS